jgi:hypothetical protein|tara:strand:- start:1818 stop:2096 length:279 start_codon:yes stop_codon:yes gene_type:complete
LVPGNSTFDADGGYLRGQKNSKFTGPAGYRNMGSLFTNWSDQGLTNYAVYDWRITLISGGLDFSNHDFEDKFGDGIFKWSGKRTATGLKSFC